MDARRIRAGGGTATVPVSGQVLAERLPVAELLELAEAVVRVFHRLGDRTNRHANRMKFLVRKLGFEGFRAEVDAERARVREEGAPRLPFDPESPPRAHPPAPAAPAPSREEIAARVRAQALRGPRWVRREDVPALHARLAAAEFRPETEEGECAT